MDNDLDNVIGILRFKDYVLDIGKDDFSLEGMLVKPVFFHEDTNVYDVLEGMKRKKVSRALIGDMQDDVEEEPDIVERAGGDGWLVDGQCMIYDFLIHFDLEYQMQDYEYSTVAGLIIDELGRLPEIGECVQWRSFSFEIVDMDGPRIDKVIIKPTAEFNRADDSN